MGLFERVMLLVACHLASYEGRVQLGGAPMHIPAQRVDRDMSPGQGRTSGRVVDYDLLLM